MKKEKLKHIAKRITALAAAVAMAATFTFPSEVGDGFFDGFGNAIVASAYDRDYDISTNRWVTIWDSGTYRIFSSNPDVSVGNQIIIKKDASPNIVLENVNIDVSGTEGACAFVIEDDSSGNVTINLVGKNTLKSGSRCPGLQKNGTTGTLTIQGEGELIVTGSISSAGIGSGERKSCSNITINSGTITATGNAAGIGSGDNGTFSNITINGGTVIATGKSFSAGIGGGLRGSGSGITITGGTVTAIGSSGAGIGGGQDAAGSDIKITGGSVKAKANTYAIGGGSGAVTPTLADGTTKVYLLTIANPGDDAVYIDGSTTPYNPSNHSAAGTGDEYLSLYAYLTGEDHTVTIGTGESAVTTDYKFYSDINGFLPVPKASDFTFTAPTDPIVYDGSEKEATVTGKSGTGTVTVKYYLIGEDDSETELTNGKPVNAGTYKVKIDVDKGTSYADVQDLTAETWKFTITSGTLTADYFDFTAPSNLEYDGNAKTVTVEAKNGITGIGDITVKYQKTGETTATTEAPKTPGTYKVSIDVAAGDNYAAVTGLTADAWEFTITKATPIVPVPTAPTAISYGKTLADAGLTAGWAWEDENTVPSPANTYTAYKELTDDDIYNYNGLSGFTYDATNHKLSCEVPVTVNPVTPEITVTASPSSAITGKATTVMVTAEVKNPNNDSLNDLPEAEFFYKIGDGAETPINGGTFVIPANTPNGTTITIIATTSGNSNYNEGRKTSTVVVSDCPHPDVPTAWETNETHHWHKCPDCGAELEKAEHSSNAPATETSPEVCKDCGKVMSTATGHTHVPSDEYSKDETGHWYACSGCTEKVDLEAHTEDSGTVTTEPTETTEGEKTFKCVKCGYVMRTETIPTTTPEHTHEYSTEWKTDSTSHWHECACGDKTEAAAHTYGSWKITVPATAEANGKKERVCTVCGYVHEGTVIYGGDETTGDIDNATDPDTNALHADLKLTDKDIINKIPLTPEELEAIENGADLEVYMVVIDYSAKVPAEDKALAESVLNDGMKIGMYIDVTLFVKVGDNTPRAVTETNGNIRITFEMPEKLINTDKNVNREYYIVRVHDSKASVLDCEYDSSTRKGLFSTDRFSTYAIAYKDISLEAPVTKYPVNNPTNGIVKTDKKSAAAGERVTVTVMHGYIAHIYGKNGNEIARISGTGSFIMPEGGIRITAEYPVNLAITWKNSYIYSYDSGMNYITVNKTRKQGTIIVDLGKKYAGKSFVIYEGKKSTKVKVTEGVLDKNGRFVFEVSDGKNYTLVVED